MKLLYPLQLTSILLFVMIFSSCEDSQKAKTSNFEPRPSSKLVEYQSLQPLLDSAKVEGSILILDPSEDIYYSNDYQKAEQAVIPASTYKIPHSIIGLELGVLEDENTVFKWDGESRAIPAWEEDLTLRQAFQRSCVPCYQEMALKIGVDSMNASLEKIGFGDMDVNSNNLDQFWLLGESKISPMEQIGFLKRLYHQELPLQEETYEAMKKVMIIDDTQDYKMSGKTGLGLNPEGDIAWFVGFLEFEQGEIYFATRITQADTSVSRQQLMVLRKDLTMAALKELKIME